MNGIQPQRYLRQFNRGGIQVDAKDFIGGDIGLDLLLFLRVGVMTDGLTGFLLFQPSTKPYPHDRPARKRRP